MNHVSLTSHQDIEIKDDREMELVEKILPIVHSHVEKKYRQWHDEQSKRRRDLVKNRIMCNLKPEVAEHLKEIGFDVDEMEELSEFGDAMKAVMEISHFGSDGAPDYYDLDDRSNSAPYIVIDYTIDEAAARREYDREMQSNSTMRMLGITYEQWLEHKKMVALNRDLNSF